MAEILIYDFIGQDFFGEGVTAKKIKAQLDAIPAEDDITVRINSGGGDVFDGFAIYSLLSERGVDVVIDGLAASAASVIAMAGNTISMSDAALMMIHDPWTFSIGNSVELRSQADLLDKIKDSILNAYSNKASVSRDELAKMMSDETWFDASEAHAIGLVTETTEPLQIAASVKTDYPWIKNAPRIIKQEIKQDTTKPETYDFRVAARTRLQNLTK